MQRNIAQAPDTGVNDVKTSTLLWVDRTMENLITTVIEIRALSESNSNKAEVIARLDRIEVLLDTFFRQRDVIAASSAMENIKAATDKISPVHLEINALIAEAKTLSQRTASNTSTAIHSTAIQGVPITNGSSFVTSPAAPTVASVSDLGAKLNSLGDHKKEDEASYTVYFNHWIFEKIKIQPEIPPKMIDALQNNAVTSPSATPPQSQPTPTTALVFSNIAAVSRPSVAVPVPADNAPDPKPSDDKPKRKKRRKKK